MNEPLVSIITPVFNSKLFLKETIESVILQTYKNWELLLLDDASTDESLEICEQYSKLDSRVKVHKNSQNLGISATRNLGIQLARGGWISFLDSDDFWKVNKIELQLSLAQKTGGKFIYGNYSHVSEGGDFLKSIHCSSSISYKQMLQGSEIGCLTVMVDADILKQHKFKNIFHEDYLLWLELLKNDCERAYAVQEDIASYRLRPNSRSANKIECAKAQWNIYRQNLDFNILKSSYYFLQYASNGAIKHWSQK